MFCIWACAQVGSTVFVHGGVLQQHVDYGVDRINKLVYAHSPCRVACAHWLAIMHILTRDVLRYCGVCVCVCVCRETSAWMRGESDAPSSTSQQPRPSTHTPPSAPAFLRGADAVVWSRSYSAEDRVRCDCEGLQRVLKVSIMALHTCTIYHGTVRL